MNDGKRRCLVALVLALPLFGSCGGGGGSGGSASPNSSTVTVEIVYMAATAIDPAVKQQFPDCVAAAQPTHVHPSWRNFDRFGMTRAGADEWRITFSDTPSDQQQSIRVSDPNACAFDPNGASTEGVFANGVLLTQVVSTPGNGAEPGLAFFVDAEGNVSP